MPHFNPPKLRFNRSRILASAAVLALIVGGAGEAAWTSSMAARAEPVTVPQTSEQAAPSFAPLIARVKAAVVSVKVKFVTADTEANGISGKLDALPPDVQRFFKQFQFQQGAPSGGQMVIGEGSGFFISSDGYIVTNNHVVENAKTVTVTTNDGTILDAKVIGTDPKTDLALIKVDKPGDYPFVTFAKQQPRVGDWVVAIGNPFGLGGTVTAGIVSAEGRDIGDGPYDRFLQIDAPINKGNSGGPTFNLEGQVVGVNTAIFSPSGGNIGIGFAIPASTVDSVVADLEHGGTVKRGFIGVAIQPVTPEIAESLGIASATGAIVDQVTPGAPAAQAGLKPGDVITKLNGEQVKEAGDLTRQVGALKPGEKATLAYIRDGAEKTADISIVAQKTNTVASAETKSTDTKPTLGVELAPAAQAEGAGAKGVAVVAVDPNGAAAETGLSAGDIILEVSGKPVATPDQVKSEIDAARHDGKPAVLMRVQTQNGDRFVAIPLRKA